MTVVFSKEWFEKYNKIICYVANSFLGEWIFGFKKMGHDVKKYGEICDMFPNAVRHKQRLLYDFEKHQFEQEYVMQFFVRNEYALRLQKIFYPIWFLFHSWDMKIANPLCPQLNLGFDTLEKNPAAGANSPCDGYLQKQTNSSWAATLAATPTADVSSTSIKVASGYYNNYYFVDRGCLNFDTSALTSAANISSAVVSLYVYSVDNSGAFSACVYDFNPANTDNIATSDWDNFGSSAFSDSIDINSLSPSAYNDFTLNASGKGNINKTGVSSFGMKTSNDSGEQPSNVNRFSARSGDNASNKPKLVITYSTTTKITVSDSGSGSETANITAKTTVTDSNSSRNETISVKGSIPVTDSGSGSDSLSLLLAKINIQEAGSGSENLIVQLKGLAKNVADSGSGSEAIDILRKIAITDSGSALEAIYILLELITVSDTGSGSENIGISGRNVTIEDNGLAQEAINILGKISVQDSATAIDVIEITAKIVISESGSGTDALNKFVIYNKLVSDIGSASENISYKKKVSIMEAITEQEALGILARIIVEESGHGADRITLEGWKKIARTIVEWRKTRRQPTEWTKRAKEENIWRKKAI